MEQKDDQRRRDLANYARRFSHRIIYSDMDAFRHLNNGATGRYFEEGRADLNIAIFGVECMIDPPEGQQLLFANVVTDYLAQAHYPGSVEVGSAIGRIGSSSFVMSQACFQNGACFALSQAVMVKARHGKPEPLTPAEREAMAALSFGTPSA
jgi:acyl-CoA thioester hydrolase